MKKGKENITDNGQFIRLFNNVRRHKDITPIGKLIMSHIISYQLQGMEFFMSNKRIAYEYGTSESTVARAVKKLEKYLDKRKVNIPSKDGGISMPRRYLKVKDLKSWTTSKTTAEKPVDYSKFKTSDQFFDWLNTNVGKENIEAYMMKNENAYRHLEQLSKVE